MISRTNDNSEEKPGGWAHLKVCFINSWALFMSLTAAFAAALPACCPSSVTAADHVVLLHGLARTHRSMEKMESALKEDGYEVWNISYPSRSNTIENLSVSIHSLISSNAASADRLHFVTHSMGGILVRYMHETQPFTNMGRVVMLSPPSQGSEVVDALHDLPPFHWINGPAGDQLGTSSSNLAASLAPVRFDLGIITGDRSVNWILSAIIPGRDDGKVAVERAKCPGMKDFRVIHATHPFIMKNRTAITLTRRFLKTGSFSEKPDG